MDTIIQGGVGVVGAYTLFGLMLLIFATIACISFSLAAAFLVDVARRYVTLRELEVRALRTVQHRLEDLEDRVGLVELDDLTPVEEPEDLTKAGKSR